jgi:cystathionine beta-lyase/cystathionine gamma-synthase
MPQTAELLPSPAPASYVTEEELTASLLKKGTPEPGSGLYPRDGTVEVTDIESAISELTIPGQRFNVVVGSGMAAVSGAVRYALDRTGVSERGKPPVLAYPPELYSQSTRSFEKLRNMGVQTANYQSGDPESISRLWEQKKPDVIFGETVANSPGMPVLDVHDLLARTREAGEDGPILVLDNTLLLSTGLKFEDILNPDDRVLVAESATKGLLHNSGHGGIVYSPNADLIDGFRRFKVTEGIVTSTQADASILKAIEATSPEFHERNKALYESTAKFAVALAMAQEELGADADFTVSFPTLPDHPNHDYASRHLQDGVSPVVFMAASRWNIENCAQALLKRISEHPRMREQIEEGQIYMGQSFGFQEARLLYDRNAPNVRVAGGYDIDSDALADALLEAAADI